MQLPHMLAEGGRGKAGGDAGIAGRTEEAKGAAAPGPPEEAAEDGAPMQKAGAYAPALTCISVGGGGRI